MVKPLTAQFTAVCPRCLIRWHKGSPIKSRGYVRDGGYGFTHYDCPRPAQRKPDEPFPPEIASNQILRINLPDDVSSLFPHENPIQHPLCTECEQNHPRSYNCWDEYING